MKRDEPYISQGACFDVLSFGKLREVSSMSLVEVEDWSVWDFETGTSLEMESEHLDWTLPSFPSDGSLVRSVLW